MDVSCGDHQSSSEDGRSSLGFSARKSPGSKAMVAARQEEHPNHLEMAVVWEFGAEKTWFEAGSCQAEEHQLAWIQPWHMQRPKSDSRFSRDTQSVRSWGSFWAWKAGRYDFFTYFNHHSSFLYYFLDLRLYNFSLKSYVRGELMEYCLSGIARYRIYYINSRLNRYIHYTVYVFCI